MNESNFKRIYSLLQILESKAKFFFIDIENTILKSNIYFDLIGVYPYSKYFALFDADSKNIYSFGKNYHRDLNEIIIPHLFSVLKSRGVKIFALTSGFPSKNKEKKIEELNVYFEKYLFTKCLEKGPFFVKFLKLNNINDNCAFVDNTMDKIINVEFHFSKVFPNNKIDLFLLENKQNTLINYKMFANYWDNITKIIKFTDIKK